MNTARLYFEAHITVQDPLKTDSSLSGDALEQIWNDFASWAEKNNLRASRFDKDEVDHYDGAWFLSGRDTELDSLKLRIKSACAALKADGAVVIRWKIEDTLLDSKHGDVL